MHLEILVEDSSGRRLLDHLLPGIIGAHGAPHTWRLHEYRGIGRIPRNLEASGHPAHRILLDRLPRILRGYARTPGIDAIVVVLDTDDRDCAAFLAELRALAQDCGTAGRTLFRLAIEEIEAWYLGDREAFAAAFPSARTGVLDAYRQDSVCGTWELIADAVHPGGIAAVRHAGWPLPGQLKHEWAERIGPLLDADRNLSPSFGKLRDGLRRLTSRSPAPAPN